MLTWGWGDHCHQWRSSDHQIQRLITAKIHIRQQQSTKLASSQSRSDYCKHLFRHRHRPVTRLGQAETKHGGCGAKSSKNVVLLPWNRKLILSWLPLRSVPNHLIPESAIYNFTRRHFDLYIYFFPEKKRIGISGELPADNSHEMLNLII